MTLKYRYSRTEEKLLKFLPRKGQLPTTTKHLVSKLYRNRETPMHGQIVVANALRALAVKIQKNREKFRLKRSSKSGPRKIQFWIE